MKTKKIKLSDIKIGLIKQEVLPDGFIERVIKYKDKLKEVEDTSLEETVCNFQRDAVEYRLSELVIWEKIADKYEELVNENKNLSISQRKELFVKLLSATL